MPEATNQEKLDQIVSQMYKQDFWAGDGSKDARAKFIGQLLNHGIQVGDSKDATSLAQFVRWYGAGLDNVYRAILVGNAQTAALVELVKALTTAAAPGAAAFDQEAFLERVKGIIDTSVEEGLGSLRLTTEAN